MNPLALPTRRSLLKIAAGLPLAPLLLQPAAASAPGPVSLMVPYPAGGPSDVSARILSKPIGEGLAAKVIVENLGGATGTIAASKVLGARADGSMFFQGTQNELILPPLTNKAVRYQPDAFENLQYITVTHLVLLVRSGLPARNMQEFLALARSRNESNSLTYGSVGVGSLYHLITEYMGKVVKVPFTHAPYAGTAPVIQDLAGGQIDFSIMPFQASMLEMTAPAASGRWPCCRATGLRCCRPCPASPKCRRCAISSTPAWRATSSSAARRRTSSSA